MLDAAHLRAFADLAGPERAFLTVYLDSTDTPSALDARLDDLEALVADVPAEAEHFAENRAIVTRLLHEHAAPVGGALAVFAGFAVDLAEVVPLPVAVGTVAGVGDAPYVRPAYELLDEHEPFAVAVVDATAARVFLVTADDAEAVARVRGDVKNRVKKGGWSQKRYARRRDKQMEGYATDVAAALATLVRDGSAHRLVLLGSDEAVRAVRDALPREAADVLVDGVPVSADASDDELMAAAVEASDAGERADEAQLWDAIREQGVGPGLAAFGPSRVLAALVAARVDTLLVHRDADLTGTTCRACGHVAYGTPTTCQSCGSSDVFASDFVEMLTEHAARTGADVDFADPIPALDAHHGVAALLRY